MKRVFDFAVSLFALGLLGWAIVLLALVVRATSDGPGLFSQRRVGRDREEFTCYKLRTMHRMTVAAATHDTPQSAVTTLGRMLRRFKLDELPQFWNVLRGDMSLVGPRPCLPIQRELVAERDRRGVFAVRPGITGLAQVEGIDMSNPRRLAERDAHYVRTQSFAGDLRLIVETVLGRGRGDRVRA